MVKLAVVWGLALFGGCAGCAEPCVSDSDCSAAEFCDAERCAVLPPLPDSFLWGTAIAGYQADYGCPTLDRSICEDTASDWFVHQTDPATVGSARTYQTGEHPSEIGPGFWELYPDDLERASTELNNNAFRTSIEWSRIFPTATDEIEGFEALSAHAHAANVAHYHDLFSAMKARGITPMITLNHYALPTWIHDPVTCHIDFASCTERGWVDKERTVREIAKFAGFVGREYGAEVDLWATLNEPLQNMLFGYFQPSEARAHPPALLLRPTEARTVFDAMIEGHARMYDALKAGDTVDADGDGQASQVGIVYPMVPIDPLDPNDPADVAGAENVDYLWNRAFLNAVALGIFDHDLDGEGELRDDLVGRMDYIGVNWYFGITVAGAPTSFLPQFSPLLTVDPLRLTEGANQPDRLEHFVRRVNEEFGVPAYITENGAPFFAETPNSQTEFLVDNLQAMQRAVARGADLRGYFYWTFMDNIEWNHGSTMPMGLYAVDPHDSAKRRTLRAAGAVYGAVAGAGGVGASAAQDHLNR
jgi:beta-galactosidase